MSEDRLAEIKARWNAWADDAAKYSADTVYSHPESRERIGRLLADDMRHLLTEVERLRAENESLRHDLQKSQDAFASLRQTTERRGQERDALRGEVARLEGERDLASEDAAGCRRLYEADMATLRAHIALVEGERDRLLKERRVLRQDAELGAKVRRIPYGQVLRHHADNAWYVGPEHGPGVCRVAPEWALDEHLGEGVWAKRDANDEEPNNAS
jgi:SMC interacting uncharacterized protein involved in chromosome segregation